MRSRSAVILGSAAGMNFCPPNPGLTLMTSTIEIMSSTWTT